MKFLNLFVLILFVGCSSVPDSHTAIEKGFRQYFYKSGTYRFYDVKKINGMERSMNGAKYYTVVFDASLEVLENIQRPQRGFSLDDLPKGKKYHIHNATITFCYSDNGWIPVDMDYDVLNFYIQPK